MTHESSPAFAGEWPTEEQEAVLQCPYCGSAAAAATLLHHAVQDWSFGAAPGSWNYWFCSGCRAVYLNPRPTTRSIGKAYSRYYTHTSEAERRSGLAGRLRLRLKNEYWSQRFAASIVPRLGWPHWTAPVLSLLQRWIVEPFGLRQLAALPRGLLIDVGCGNGDTLRLARQLGWNVLGLELDAGAVEAARAQGLEVIQGGYEGLAAYPGRADCIVCSHVLEHVHQPVALLELLVRALAPGGALLLSAPNASSYLQDHYARDWRGLEAPRHLALPDAGWLAGWMVAHGLDCQQVASSDGVMMIESERIRRRSLVLRPVDRRAARTTRRTLGLAAAAPVAAGKQDVVQLVCRKLLA